MLVWWSHLLFTQATTSTNEKRKAARLRDQKMRVRRAHAKHLAWKANRSAAEVASLSSHYAFCNWSAPLPPVEKKSFDNRRRVVFFAGLESASTFEYLVPTLFSIMSPISTWRESLSDLLWLNRDSMFPMGDINQNDQLCPHRSLLRALRTWKDSAHQKDELIFLNAAHNISVRRNGYMSFPQNSGGHSRALHKPDLSLLASLAEEVGVDLRIVVIHRSATAILEEIDALKRLEKKERLGYYNHYGKAVEEVAVLADAAASLGMQLSSLDAAFIYCADFEELSSLVSQAGTSSKSWGAFANFLLHPSFGPGASPVPLLPSKWAQITHGTRRGVHAIHLNHLELGVEFLRGMCHSATRRKADTRHDT